MTLEEKIVAYGDARAMLESATIAIALNCVTSDKSDTGDTLKQLIKAQGVAIDNVNALWDDLKRTIETYDTKIL